MGGRKKKREGEWEREDGRAKQREGGERGERGGGVGPRQLFVLRTLKPRLNGDWP